jgi:signal transduction histidine kinase
MQSLPEPSEYASAAAQSTLEPGLLSVLRVLVAIQLLLLLLATLVVMPLRGMVGSLPVSDVTTWDSLQQTITEVNARSGSVVLRLIVISPIVVYAFWPGLAARLGRWYLPLFVVYYAIAAVGSHAAYTTWVINYAETVPATATLLAVIFSMESSWTLFVLLLFCVVVVAWQYELRRVLWYVLFLTAAETVVVVQLVLSSAPWLPLGIQTLTHTAIYLIVGFVITRMMAAQRAQRNALSEANLQLMRYASSQEQLAVSRERNRMARELHDTLAHSLSAVAVQLEAADSAMASAPDEAHILLAKGLAQTRSGLTETRRALHALRATPLDDLGLALAIQNLAATTAQRGGMTLALDVPEVQPLLPPEVEQGVYRIAQEALANVMRHSGATQLGVTLTFNGPVMLIVRDNGAGFDGTAVSGDHMGLQLMRERAEMLGGALDVVSHAGGGTTVRLVAP